MYTIEVPTRSRTQFVEITDRLRKIVAQSGMKAGALMLYVPHTTAGCTINENADPDVVRDMTMFVDELVPQSPRFRHAEGNSDSHLKASFFGSSLLVPIEDGKLVLGTWQGVYFCEFDGPRKRTAHVTLLAGHA